MTDVFFSVRKISFLNNGPYSFAVNENETVGLTGASGVGKTQMLRAMVEAIVFSGGLLLEGIPSTDFSSPEWRRKVSLVPAEAVWWHDVVIDHFPPTVKRLALIQAVQQLGFDEDVLSWRISRLSTGERQRLALVRSIMLQPAVLLLDEPCSALDTDSVKHVEKLLSTYISKPKRAIIWVSHDLDQLKRVSHTCYKVEQNRVQKMWSAQPLRLHNESQ